MKKQLPWQPGISFLYKREVPEQRKARTPRQHQSCFLFPLWCFKIIKIILLPSIKYINYILQNPFRKHIPQGRSLPSTWEARCRGRPLCIKLALAEEASQETPQACTPVKKRVKVQWVTAHRHRSSELQVDMAILRYFTATCLRILPLAPKPWPTKPSHSCIF